MSIAKGYKQTEVGMIPEDWEVKRIIDISLLKSGLSITANEISEIGGYSCYGGNGLRGFTKKFTHNGKYPIIGRQGALCGNINYVEGKFFASEHAVVVSVNNQTDAKWLSYVMIRMKLNQYSESSAQPGLSVNKIGILKIPFPLKKNEQTAIANALSDMDALIAQTEKLIEKKKAIKQGVMQELLQPKEGWVTKKLGEVCEIKKGQLITDSTRVNGDIPVIAGGKTPAYYHNKANRTGNIITISGSGANAGYVSFYDHPIFASDCSTISNSDKYNVEFIFYWFQLNQSLIYSLQTGGAQPHIHPSDLNPLEIFIPLIEIQNQIATIFRELQKELNKLETKLQKLKNQKQGMMQALLTGKIRLL